MARNKATTNDVELPKQAKTTNHLKLRIDDLKTFQPLTENQRLYF